MKQKRNEEDTLFIMYLLESSGSFSANIIGQNANTKTTFREIAKRLCYQGVEVNNIICRIGDYGDKYYIILKGCVSIYIHKEVTTQLSYMDYVKYLIKLKLSGEDFLATKTLLANINSFFFEASDLDYVIQEREFSPNKLSRKKFQSKNSFVLDLTSKLSNYTVEERTDKDKIKSLQEYLTFLEPERTEDSYYDLRPCVIYKLQEVHKLKKGDSFGDTGLQSEYSTRSATLISTEETAFGVLDKYDYNECIKEINEKVRKVNQSLLFDNLLFRQINNKPLVNRRIYNNFVLQKISDTRFLALCGDERHRLIVLKKGEFQLKMQMSLRDFLRTIKKLGGRIVDLISREDYTCDAKIKKFIDQQHIFRIKIVGAKEILGLDDMVYEGKWLFDVEMLSGSAEVFSLEQKLFENILLKELEIKQDKDKFEKMAKERMVERMRDIAKTYLKMFKGRDDVIKVKKIKVLKIENKLRVMQEKKTIRANTCEDEDEDKWTKRGSISPVKKHVYKQSATSDILIASAFKTARKKKVSMLLLQSMSKSTERKTEVGSVTARKMSKLTASRIYNRESFYNSIYIKDGENEFRKKK